MIVGVTDLLALSDAAVHDICVTIGVCVALMCGAYLFEKML